MDLIEPRTLRTKPISNIALLSVSVGFVGVGRWMVHEGQWSGWLIIGFFGVCALVAIALMLPGASYLRLNSEGFTMCCMYRSHTFKWSDVAEFDVSQIFGNTMVMMNFSDSYKASPSVRKFNVATVGFDGALPNSYGLKPEELADLMNRYKASSHAV